MFTARTAQVGARVSFSQTITQDDLEAMVALTGDRGGYHVDERFARAAGFRTLITPGLVQAGLVTKIGGSLNYLAHEFTLTYLKPVYVGDQLTATMEVKAYDAATRRIRIEGGVTNQHGEEVLACRTAGYLPDPAWGVPEKPRS